MRDFLIEMAIRRDLHRVHVELEGGHFAHAIELALIIDECLDIFGY